MFRLLSLILCSVFLAQPVRAEVNVTVSYSEAADLYSTMDNVSGWLEGYTWPEYRTEWSERFGWSAADQVWIDRYTEFRRRTFIEDGRLRDPRNLPDGIFAPQGEGTSGSDPLAMYFLAQPNIKTALRNLDRAFTRSDARMLRGFYYHFASRWRVLLQDNEPLVNRANALQERMQNPEISHFIDTANAFYQSEVSGPFTVYFTRRPPGSESSAEPLAGNYILLHTSAEENEAEYWDTIVMHELVHFVSSRQRQEQKQTLTARFLNRCPLPKGAKLLWLIEEPLAVAWGQAAYSAQVLHKPLDPLENWYGIPWVNIVSRTIAPTIITGYRSDLRIEDVIDQAADRCVDLTTISNQLE